MFLVLFVVLELIGFFWEYLGVGFRTPLLEECFVVTHLFFRQRQKRIFSVHQPTNLGIRATGPIGHLLPASENVVRGHEFDYHFGMPWSGFEC
jgi:hypothetical protein